MPPHALQIPDLLVEKLAAGELSDARLRALKQRYHLDDEAIEALIASIHQQNRATLEAHPPEQFAAQIEARTSKEATIHHLFSPPTWRSGLAIAAALTLTAGGALTLLDATSTQETAHHSGEELALARDTTRIKGPSPSPLTPHDERLRVWRAQHPAALQLEHGDALQEGDTVQLEYIMPHHARPGVILSIDGDGTVTLHHPSSTSSKAVLEQGTHRLPYSYTLDDAPLFERFILVECTREIDLARMLEAFEQHTTSTAFSLAPRTSSPRLPDDTCTIQADQLFDKRPPHRPRSSP